MLDSAGVARALLEVCDERFAQLVVCPVRVPELGHPVQDVALLVSGVGRPLCPCVGAGRGASVPEGSREEGPVQLQAALRGHVGLRVRFERVRPRPSTAFEGLDGVPEGAVGRVPVCYLNHAVRAGDAWSYRAEAEAVGGVVPPEELPRAGSLLRGVRQDSHVLAEQARGDVSKQAVGPSGRRERGPELFHPARVKRPPPERTVPTVVLVCPRGQRGALVSVVVAFDGLLEGGNPRVHVLGWPVGNLGVVLDGLEREFLDPHAGRGPLTRFRLIEWNYLHADDVTPDVPSRYLDEAIIHDASCLS